LDDNLLQDCHDPDHLADQDQESNAHDLIRSRRSAASVLSKIKPMHVPSEFKKIVYIRYADHVAFNRASPLMLTPQIRETIGWIFYETDTYITIEYDRDNGPPTLKGGDAKASGLVLRRSDILEIKKLDEWLSLKRLSNNTMVRRISAKRAKNSALPQEETLP
jgi:hypothetical protein